MGRKNKREPGFDTWIEPIKDEYEYRSMPKCWLFPNKAVFTSGWRAQVTIDEIRSRSSEDKLPQRVYECTDEGGCGFFHITSNPIPLK